MDVCCPSSSLTTSLGPLSRGLARSFNKRPPSCAPRTSDWSMCRYFRNSLPANTISPPNTISRHISGRSSGIEGREICGRRTATSMPLLLDAGRFRVSDTSEVGYQSVGRLTNRTLRSFVCRLKFGAEQDVDKSQEFDGLDEDGGQLARGVGQVACWVITVVYVGWLFLLPYAPGDPAWAITPSSIQMLIDLSLNFFFVLPLASMLTNAAGFHDLTAPVQHPTAEALLNLVVSWTLLFAPLLFTDKKRNRFSGSLEALWMIQMLLTNVVLPPYMAIRQNKPPIDKGESAMPLQKKLPLRIELGIVSRGMISGAFIVGVTGALVGIVSLLWAVIGRPDAGFGGFAERWEYFVSYVGSERLGYALVWDLVLYSFFQPWLIGDNLGNVKLERREAVRVLRYVPFVGLVAYVFGLQEQESPKV